MSQVDNAQTVELQQTDAKKSYLDLNVTSTDTTAIESFKQASLVSEKAFEKSTNISNASFDYAIGIAVFLALCATGLAYWFGVRSFELTKQSFDALLKQIESSEQVALRTNKDILEHNKNIEVIKQEFELEYRRTGRLKENFANFITNAENLNIEIFKLNFAVLNKELSDEKIESKRSLIQQNQRYLDLQRSLIKFEFNDTCEEELALEALIYKIILELTWLEGNILLSENNNRSLDLENLIKEAGILMKTILYKNRKAA